MLLDFFPSRRLTVYLAKMFAVRIVAVLAMLVLVLMGNNLPVFRLIRDDPGRVREAIAWYLQATGGYGVKLVNPGGVEMWKRGNGNVTSLDDEGPGVTPRRVIETIATAVHDRLEKTYGSSRDRASEVAAWARARRPRFPSSMSARSSATCPTWPLSRPAPRPGARRWTWPT